jgi:hypothetical protein
MKPIAKLGWLAAACALLIITFSIIGPRAVRAAVATLVQVANTASSPVPTVATDNPALQPFAASAENGGLYNLNFAVPAGKTLVIETLSLSCSGSTAITGQTPDVRVFVQTGGASMQYTFAPTLNFANEQLIVTQPLRAYADAGSSVGIGSGSAVPLGWTCYAVLSGHLVNPI